ncbi:MAG: RluA family pseudouridine synthase [Minisyncoccota bacterium]
MNIPILYEDDEILAINKPAGLVVHPDGRTKEETLVDWVHAHYPKIALDDVGESIVLTGGGEIKKPGIVHRIDRETSGVLLIAKTHASFQNLKAQFQAREIKKNYKAFVYGVFKDDRGTIDRPIGRSKTDFRRWSAEYGARGELREAMTEYRVLGAGEAGEVKVSYLDVFPHTGRTHQIRVHLKAVGHPIVCDKLYAPKMPCVLGFDRVALHASSVVFKTLDGEEKRVEAPIPEDFKAALAELSLVC